MGHLIDSSVLIGMERRGLHVADFARIAADEPSAIATITASELIMGVHCARRLEVSRRAEPFIERILEEIPVLAFDLAVARVHAQLWAQLKGAGRMIGPHDLLIAATASTHGYSVLTDNLRDFERVPGLLVRQPQWPQ